MKSQILFDGQDWVAIFGTGQVIRNQNLAALQDEVDSMKCRKYDRADKIAVWLSLIGAAVVVGIGVVLAWLMW